MGSASSADQRLVAGAWRHRRATRLPSEIGDDSDLENPVVLLITITRNLVGFPGFRNNGVYASVRIAVQIANTRRGSVFQFLGIDVITNTPTYSRANCRYT